MTGERAIRHVVIRGRVQGVGYRGWTEEEAWRRGLEGWVRNRSDGSVEAVFCGPPDSLAAMIEACRRGPRSAQVTAIEERDGTAKDLAERRPGESFSVRATV